MLRLVPVFAAVVSWSPVLVSAVVGSTGPSSAVLFPSGRDVPRHSLLKVHDPKRAVAWNATTARLGSSDSFSSYLSLRADHDPKSAEDCAKLIQCVDDDPWTAQWMTKFTNFDLFHKLMKKTVPPECIHHMLKSPPTHKEPFDTQRHLRYGDRVVALLGVNYHNEDVSVV